MSIDWDKIKIHCSSLYGIMVAGDGYKTNYDLWQEACAERDKKTKAYEKLQTKNGKNGNKWLARLDELDLLIPELEKKKDIIEDPPLSKGCKTLLSGVYASEKYHKWSPNKDIGSKHTEKGKEVESDGLNLVSVLDGVLLCKNEERLQDDHFSGLPDSFEGENIHNADIIHEIKCPWDIETFFSYLGKELIPQYYWQVQGYMALSGAKLAKIHFCLVDTPPHQIKRALDTLLSRMNVVSEYSPEFIVAQNELINNMTFGDIPISERRILFTVERNDDDIERARKRVEKCREYLAEFENIHLNLINPEKSRNLSYETSKE